MNEDEARKVEIVRAVETEDSEATLLTREDRLQAEGYARAGNGPARTRTFEQTFVVRRAEFAATRLATRHPGLARLAERSRWPGWIGWAAPAVALAAGFLANEFGTDKRLDLLAVPLLGTITWNLVVYLLIATTAVSGKGHLSLEPILRAITRTSGSSQAEADPACAVQRAARSFRLRWARLSAPLNGARFARTLHLGAALFAAGLIGGIYGRALVIEYRAGWESTFLGPDAVHALLSLVLGPASLATGLTIPSASEVAGMRWTGPATGGVNAARWIHLYTATLVGLVVAPRLLLAAWQAAKALRLSRRFPMPGREDFYIRRVVRAAGGTAATARVTPYAYRPGEETRRRLARALGAALGEGAQVRFDEPVEYGAEEQWLAGHALDPADDYHVLLFSVSATPESENHGTLAAELGRRIAREQPGTVLAAILDESPYRGHFAGQAGLDERLAQRVDAWRRVLEQAGVASLAVDLSQQLDDNLAQRIESGLLADGALRG
jgi:hypothetical protein